MSSAELVSLILGSLCLLMTGALVFAFSSKAASEKALRTEIDGLRSQLTEAAKTVGQIEELSRSLERAQNASRELEERFEGERIARETISRELATVQAGARATVDAAENRARQEHETAQKLIDAERSKAAELLAGKDRELAARDKELEGLKEFLDGLKSVLGDQFKALSVETLKDFSSQFEKAAKQIIDQNSEVTQHNVKLHKQQIEQMLQPVEKTLEQLDAQVRETNEKRGQAEAVLTAQIQQWAGTNEKLASALSKPVIRGSFGEYKLQQLLEAAGLVNDEDFELQVSIRDGDQTRIIDALIHLPQNRKLVIDSKNLLKPFVEYATTEGEEKPLRLTEFQQQFRSTLRSLSMKDYSKHWDGIDAVIMFLPDEGMYMAAIESDRQLIGNMFEHRVFTVSPISLLPILRSVAYILGLEKQNRDTTLIVEAGRSMYESLGTIFGKLDTLGERLSGGMKAYNEVVASFEGNVLPKARALEQMGVKKGTPHKTVKAIDVPRREFKERVVRELSAPPEMPLLELAFVPDEPAEDDRLESL